MSKARNSRKPFTLSDMEDPETTRDLALILIEIQESTDPVTLLVRGAIILDDLLTGLLESYLHFTQSMRSFDRKYRLFFAGKCDLARGVGLLSKSERLALLIFNEFRNRVAHRIDVHVYDEEVQALIMRLQSAGWSSGPDDRESKLGLIESLREIIISLMGLLIMRSIHVSASGKLKEEGFDLGKESLRIHGLMGGLFTVVASARERLITGRTKIFRDKIHGIIADVESEYADANLSTEEAQQILNERLKGFTISTDELRRAVTEQLEPLTRRMGIDFSIDQSLTMTLSHDPTDKAETPKSEA